MTYEVTIGIPVYNVEKYVAQTIESVLAQTFESIEFLFCDDCGTDSSMDIVRQYQEQHPRGKHIHTVRQPHNKGLGEARNRMLDEAQGKYIFFMDSDDTIVPNAIELLYGNAKQYNADIVYGSMRKILLYDNNKEIAIKHRPQVFLQKDQFANFAFSRYDAMPASTCNFLIRIDVYRRHHLRYQPINYWEDFTFTMDLPAYVQHVVLLPDITYDYLCRSNSMSNYSQRSHIDKQEILTTMNALNQLKQRSKSLSGRSFFSQRMWKLMLTCFYVVCSVLRNEHIIKPAFETTELRDFLRYPIPPSTFFHFRKWRLRHALLFMLGHLPASLAISLVRIVGNKKGLI